ncbi:aromatic acid exporter family protein [Microbacterium sp. R86528]|uniref:aromatic acid exporter family protein n=1 Tax=Microbacterium sp. R86528 TaxID=3093864 RepID=UPI0037C6BD7C
MRMTSALRASRRAPLLQVAKSAIATAAAWIIAGWLVPGQPPVFAAIAALLVVQPSLNQSLAKAIERSVGVIAGVVIASTLGIVFGDETWVVVTAIVIALLLAWALKMTAGTANQIAISAILVLALATTSPSYAFDRILETLIGAVIGVIVNLALVPPVVVAPAAIAVNNLGAELAASLDRLGDALQQEQTNASLEELLLTARLMKPMRDAAETAIADGAESLTLNPRAGRHRADLTTVQELLDRYGPIVTQVIGMTRAYYDHYDRAIAEDASVKAISEQLHRAAHDVRLGLAKARNVDGVSDLTSPIPALTAPLAIVAPSEHWILVGSLLEDLRRIHDALAGRS